MTILQPVARSGCGCDGHDVAKKLITIDAALALIADRTAAVDGTENIPLDQALGRILARPVTSRFMSPAFRQCRDGWLCFCLCGAAGRRTVDT